MKKSISFLVALMIVLSSYGQNIITDQKEILATYFVGAATGTTAYQNGNLITGTPYACDCPVGYVAVGYQGKTGALIDSYVLRCRQVNADGTLGTTVTVTSPNGISTGGNAVGPFDLGPNLALVGMHIRAGDNCDYVEGFGQSIAYIAGGSSNATGASAATGLGNISGGSDKGTIWVPNGNVIVGMMVYPTQYACGVAWRYTPVYNTTGIATNETQDQIMIYPNPATENISIESASAGKSVTVSICNLQGQVVAQQPMLQTKTDINISSLNKGLYVIKISSLNGIAVRKFLKE
jgi:hypothetical protein